MLNFLLAQLEFYTINNLLAKSPVLNDLRLTENYPNRNEDYYEVTIPRYTALLWLSTINYLITDNFYQFIDNLVL